MAFVPSIKSFSVLAVITLCLLLLASMSVLAQTRIEHSQVIQRGPGDAPAIHVNEGETFAALRDADGRLLLLHFRTDADHRLSGDVSLRGALTAGHAVTQTLFDTKIAATLNANTRNDAGGALTLHSFLREDGELRLLDRHRALPESPEAFRLQVSPAPARTPGLRAPVQSQGSGVISPGGSLRNQPTPGVHGSVVDVVDVSHFMPELGLGEERVATAIVDENGALRLDIWALDSAKVFRHLSTASAGHARSIALARWTRGVVSAFIDGEGKARFIAWEIDSTGAIARRGTVAGVHATNVAISSFGEFLGGNSYLSALRDAAGTLQVMLVELSIDGMTHRVVANGIGPRVTSFSITRSARLPDSAFEPQHFYTVVGDAEGGLSALRWFRSGTALRTAVRRNLPERVTAVAVGLDPYFPSPEGEDVIVSLSGDSGGRMRLDLWRSGFRQIARPSAFESPTTPRRSLVFSANSPNNRLSGDTYPEDMPPPNLPSSFDGCTQEQTDRISRAWTRGHFFMWRAHQTMEWLNDNRKVRKAAFEYDYVSSYGSVREGLRNYAPRAYFGTYNTSRFEQARDAIGKVWRERFRDGDFTVICRSLPLVGSGAHPCFTTDASANHFLLGRINFCARWLNRSPSVNQDARLIIHEVFHWLKIPNVIWWVTDQHDYWTKCGLGGYRAVRVLYGDDALYLGRHGGCEERNHRRAVRANDNYAYFAHELGRRVYSGELLQFPRATFWQTQR